VVAIVGAVRLARAGSSWAKKRYSPERQAKAAARTAAFDKRWDPALRRLGNLIAGSPSTP
jgi:lysyl-tRNA synthetase class 2